MLKSHSILQGMAIALLLSSSLAAQDRNLSTVVATVGETELTLGHMLDVKRQLPDQYQSLDDNTLFNGIIEQLIQQELLASSMTKDPSWLAIAMQNQRRNILSSVVINELRTNAVTERALQAAYAAKFPVGSGEQEYKASHILVETEQKARELLALLDGGADFSGLATEHSTGPSGPRGGDLGWFGKGQMVAPFEKAVMGMEAGTYTGPVQTQFGYHLIFLNDRRETSSPAFEDVRSELEVEIQNAAVEEHLRGLMATANVIMPTEWIDPSILSTLDLIVK
ncbi:MAG: peptidylprolyl isomerase [Planktomarina sp.]|jgi:peptidyl-prolyl cis-trans isomerase C|nr:peptidylprolyl isomerase [Planktomarina sp.]MDT2057303.1 peptidylprolyl isomerase [Planktomarina sp.]MDT2078107.1 peptidylprolyl isomerase [Planktomarina sp.]